MPATSKLNKSCQLDFIAILMYAILCFAMIFETCGFVVYTHPTSNSNSFAHVNKLDEKLIENDSPAEQSFRQFVQSQPESTYIGELKPNSSELETMLFRNKIASAILSMKEMEMAQNARPLEATGGDCYIEVTRVERVPGKCRKVNNGLPICQSKNYMAINTDCN